MSFQVIDSWKNDNVIHATDDPDEALQVCGWLNDCHLMLGPNRRIWSSYGTNVPTRFYVDEA